MKKTFGFVFIVLFSILFMSGCSFSGVIDKFTKQAKGVILYGNEDVVKNDISKNKKLFKSSDTYPIKVEKTEGQSVLIMNEKTAKNLMKKELLNKVDSDNNLEPVKSISKVTKNKPVLFSKEKLHDLKIGSTSYDVNYQGNIIIGDGRSYVDSFMIVNDSTLSSINTKEKTMGVLDFKDKYNPKRKLKEFKSEYAQLTSID